MNDNKAKSIIDQANQELDDSIEEPMSMEEFIDEFLKDPSVGRTAHQYLLDAIEHFGTRKVFEGGEQKERYVFFDDPHNNGEHAVMGNTEMLNKFVDELRMIANSDERMQKIILFNGPTATGKSELRRCIVNGLREYSKTDDGRRYTCEWNLKGVSDKNRGLSYSDNSSPNDEEWYESPVQINPLSIIPRNVRNNLYDTIDYNYRIPVDIELDPFSKEVYNNLIKNYGRYDSKNMFSKITSEDHLKISRFIMEETKGIGILTAEDDGSVKERLLGSWMPSMIQELNSKGRKDPRAFSYDGVLSQGNSGIMVIEDATKHADILAHLLNVPDESHAKIDQKIGFDIDTVPIFISNPDLVEQKLEGKSRPDISIEDIHGSDPLKAIKRRIFQYKFKYLTSLTYEFRLIRKEINGKVGMDDNINIQDPIEINDTEFSPHTIESVAMYDVVSRLSDKDLPKDMDLVDKALLFDRGYIETEDGEVGIEEFDIVETDDDGSFGIPVTYTRDIIRSLVHSSNNDDDVYLPDDVLEKVNEGTDTAPVFSEKESNIYEDRLEDVKEYIHEEQEKDVINSILSSRQATESAIKEYIDNLYSWANDEDYNELLLKDFETTHLGTGVNQYNGKTPNEKVKEMRQDRIIKPLNRYHWRQRNDDFKIDGLDLKDVPELSSIIGDYNWNDVFNQHENLNPIDWNNPPDNTVTDDVKQTCIKNMVKDYDYSQESAKKTSERVFKRNKEELVELYEEYN